MDLQSSSMLLKFDQICDLQNLKQQKGKTHTHTHIKHTHLTITDSENLAALANTFNMSTLIVRSVVWGCN